MEEMAGNIVTHGLSEDRKRHTVDLRIVFKSDDIMIRFTDDCIPFDPKERQNMMTPSGSADNIGLRMVARIVKEESYQNILGLNVLTLKI